MATAEVGEIADILQLLGLTRPRKGRHAAGLDLQAEVRKGLPFSAFESVQSAIAITRKQLGTILGVPERTVGRRRDVQLLSPAESDRLYRLARIMAEAFQALGSRETAARWLKSPNRALGAAPLDLLDTDIGTRRVEEVLIRIRHGIAS